MYISIERPLFADERVNTHSAAPVFWSKYAVEYVSRPYLKLKDWRAGRDKPTGEQVHISQSSCTVDMWWSLIILSRVNWHNLLVHIGCSGLIAGTLANDEELFGHTLNDVKAIITEPRKYPCLEYLR